MSAYDMTFSDTIYGRDKSGRYVIENRLHKMLDRELKLLQDRIGEKMPDRRFFVFANTVATKSPKRGRPGHGWLGVAFQTEPGGPIQKVVIHVHLFESLIESQQNLIGVLGVNLLYGALTMPDDPELLIESLRDGLVGRKFQVDLVKVSGPCFDKYDNRLLSLKLLSLGLANALLFDEKGKSNRYPIGSTISRCWWLAVVSVPLRDKPLICSPAAAIKCREAMTMNPLLRSARSPIITSLRNNLTLIKIFSCAWKCFRR